MEENDTTEAVEQVRTILESTKISETNVVENDHPQKLDMNDMGDINVMHAHIKNLKSELKNQFFNEALEIGQRIEVLDEEVKTLQEESESKHKIFVDTEQFIYRHENPTFQDIGEKKLSQSRVDKLCILCEADKKIQNRVIEEGKELKIKYERSQKALEKKSLICDNIEEPPTKLTSEEREAMRERYINLQHKNYPKSVIAEREVELKQLNIAVNKKHRAFDRATHRLNSLKYNMQNSHERVEKIKWQIMEFHEQNKNAGKTEFSHNNDLLGKSKKDFQTLKIYVTKLRSQLRVMGEMNHQNNETVRILRKNGQDLQEELKELTHLYNLAEEDKALVDKLEAQSKKAVQARNEKRQYCHDQIELMEKLDMELKHIRHNCELTEKQLKRHITETLSFKKSFEGHDEGEKQDRLAVEKLQVIAEETGTQLASLDKELNALKEKNNATKDEIKNYKELAADYQKQCKGMMKEVNQFKKVQEVEVKNSAQLSALRKEYEESLDQQDRLIFNYCIDMLAPEEVGHPVIGQAHRMDDKWVAKRIELLEEKVKELASKQKYYNKKQKFYAGYVKDQSNTTAATKFLESEISDHEEYFTTWSRFWNTIALDEEIKEIKYQFTELKEELDRKLRDWPKLKKQFELKNPDATNMNKIFAINEKNMKLFDFVQKIRFDAIKN